MDFAVINGNYAIQGGLKVADALASESVESESAQTYANVLVVKEGNENDPAILALVDALKTEEVRASSSKTPTKALSFPCSKICLKAKISRRVSGNSRSAAAF